MDSNLPQDMREYVPAVEQAAMITLRAGNYALAERITRELLEAVLDRQKLDNRRIHKGSFYHNIGFSLVMQNQLAEALRSFLLAYVEDCVNARKTEDEADTFPAARVLTRGFSIGEKSLSLIKNLVSNNRKTPTELTNPEIVLTSFLKESKIEEQDLMRLCVQPVTNESVQRALFVNLTSEAASFLDELVSKRKEDIIQKAAAIASRRGSRIVTGSDIREARKQLEESE